MCLQGQNATERRDLLENDDLLASLYFDVGQELIQSEFYRA
jgi:hypothetical protein